MPTRYFTAVSNDYRLHSLKASELEPWLSALGQLRIRVFREYPYLYDGSQDYEVRYLRRYMDAADALVVIVTDHQGNAVGATTCLPLSAEEPEFREPFERAAMNVDEVFYFGESVLLPEWRGRGVGKLFFDLREAHARALGYRVTAFCAVDRQSDHPARPADYRPLDGFWSQRGYEKQEQLKACFSWKQLGETKETQQTLTFWTKHWT